MKKYLYFVVCLLFFSGFELAVAANKNVNNSTCAGLTPEDKIERRVDAAKIDYSLNPEGFREKLVKEIMEIFGQEYQDKIGFFVYTMMLDGAQKVTDSVEVVVVENNKEQNTLRGSYIMTDKDLAKKYGTYFFEAKKRNGQLVGLIQQSKNNFKPEDLGVAFPNKFIQLNDGRIIAMFSGCTPHNCAGTENLVAYDVQNEKAYVLQENSDSTKAYIYGKPDPEVRNILLYEYLYY